MSETEARIERAARALWERDARRSVGSGRAQDERVWRRVKPEYMAAARSALEAADGQENLSGVAP